MKTCTICKKEQADSQFGKYRYDLNRCASCHFSITTQENSDRKEVAKKRSEAYLAGETNKPTKRELIVPNDKIINNRKRIYDLEEKHRLARELEDIDDY